MTAPGRFNTLHLNLTRKPLEDLKVRQAIRYAIDSQAVAASVRPPGHADGRRDGAAAFAGP